MTPVYDFLTGERVKTWTYFCPNDGGGTVARAAVVDGKPLLVLCCQTCAWEGRCAEATQS